MLDVQERAPAAAGRTTQDMPALTALRAFAALLVFLYHFPPQGRGRLVDVVTSQGHVGVTVFFVLSGFLITLRYYPQFARGEPGISDYFVRRAARILPLYFAVLTLTHLLSTGFVPADADHLLEWTLTHALFGSSPDVLTVPTSWSLTVEEGFYASAPLLFLGVAALRRRLGALPGAALALGAAVAGLYLAGSVVLHLAPALGAADLRFLSDEVLLRSRTIFGRVPDFAVGVAAGLLFLSGRVESAWRRRGGALMSTALAASGAALLVAGQAGMVRDAANPLAEWNWNPLVVVASAALVLASTCRQAPLSRLLAFRGFVYLGRTSYALYLIQLTPLGEQLMYRFLSERDGNVNLLALYVGMSLVSALLFELVEEPARQTILAVWRGSSVRALLPARTDRARGLAIAILLGALTLQHGLWTFGAMDPVDEARVERVLGPESGDVLRATIQGAENGGEPRLWLPETWRRGRPRDQRPPPSLLVFVDGRPVPFLGAQPPAGPEATAYYRRSRAEYLRLRLEPPAVVTAVNLRPRVALALTWSRWAEAPVLGSAPPLLAVAAFIWWRSRGWIWAPRTCLALAASLVAIWLVAGVYLQPWAPLALALELTALLWVGSSRGTAAPADRRGRLPARQG